jgi:AraC family transcriptional regulator
MSEPLTGAPLVAKHSASTALSEIAISSLLEHQPDHDAETICPCQLTKIELQDGIDLLIWKGNLAKPLVMHVHDDWNRVNFCYALKGRSEFALRSRQGHSDYVFQEGMSCISYTPGCRGRSIYCGELESLCISIEPTLVHELVPGMETKLRDQLQSGQCYIQKQNSAEMQVAAQSLSRSLNSSPLPCKRDICGHSRLWLLGQSLILVSLTMKSCEENSKAIRLNAEERRKLLLARDLLLADLTKAPTIAALSHGTGLTILKLKQGFRQMFDESIYGLFQKERMQEAKRRFQAGNASVMVVASDLGYTNASHFSAAFQKQFGIKPSTLKHWQ